MILPDVNLLVYAYNRHAPRHAPAKRWWEGLLNGSVPVGIPWAVSCGFIRVMTHPAVFDPPLPAGRAVGVVRSWLESPVVQVLDPGPRHLEILAGLIGGLGVGGNLTTDAHLAAIAIEYRCELQSSDADFGRFPGLRWSDPLARAR